LRHNKTMSSLAYSYFGLLPESQRGSPNSHASLNNYVPQQTNPLMVSPNFNGQNPLPFDGTVQPHQYVLVQKHYNDPRLLGVVGNSPEMVQYYQRGKPEYIDAHYPDIPLARSQSQYMSTHGNVYENLVQPYVPTGFPPT
jgi:hypothetical protein